MDLISCSKEKQWPWGHRKKTHAVGQNSGSEQLQVLRQPVFLNTELREILTTVAGGILRTQLWEYFPALSVQHSWIQSPFVTHNEDAVAGLSSKEQDSLVQLSCDTALKLIFT